MFTLGIDIGSTTSKAVIVKDGREIVASSVVIATVGTDGVSDAIENVLGESGLEHGDISVTFATGYGRQTYPDADGQVSELTCHALGVHHVFPDARTVIDIGGQDAKVLALNERGRMANFVMNDKCAAGTGRFLDVMANILKLDISQLEVEAAKALHPAGISNTCTVFAESEVISQLAAGTKIPDLVAGICKSVASRAASLAKRVGVRETVCMSGGVARNAGVRKALEQELNVNIASCDMAQLMGALGASLYAYEKA
ncbi:2-hydroxyisocaproyl-CoA dehydratase activator [Caprobacter fermentans]|uniref:2-hydroxyglutaryl-CoA dehydratase n=1 Tax=Caproicibacter fermentans TaxID=2576756 RepID=A0A6N8HV45_9FIRM|nr:acyl-CoA dehydratase activase [Caproicibacter fermentans]MVB09559.1 2-hydroxyisocaproyl-CoA dehydratase activator [Caproicibacter fermentans]OCN02168.1 2-hydroxyglutaryl-CoA dehydratase [Clostridium sp. W14A]QNK41424.1 2-hydroxyglutaryl-CoA dehydratase [Caproicibacter fermentans]